VSHPDPDSLALVALSESLPDPAEEAHLATCPRCQAELDQLRAVIATARTVSAADTPQAPPPAVWDRIAADLRLADPGQESAGGTIPAQVPSAGPRPDRTDPAASPGHRRATVVPLHRRRSSWLAVAAAALVGLAVGAGVAHLAAGSPAQPVTVAGAPPAAGAQLVTSAPVHWVSGSVAGTTGLWAKGAAHMVTVTVTGLPNTAGATYRVSLGDGAGTAVALGVLPTGSEGVFVVPAAVDLDRDRVVTITRLGPGAATAAVGASVLPTT
jgi:hypothetical protein